MTISGDGRLSVDWRLPASPRWRRAIVVGAAAALVVSIGLANEESTVFRDVETLPVHSDRNQFEMELFKRVNEYREMHGLQQLVWDDALAVVCRSHSESMLTRRKLAHTLDGVTLEERLEEAQISFVCVRENVGWLQGFNVDPVEWELAHWRVSPVHDRNLRDSCVTHGAVGLVFSVDGNFYVTWIARRPPDDSQGTPGPDEGEPRFPESTPQPGRPPD